MIHDDLQAELERLRERGKTTARALDAAKEKAKDDRENHRATLNLLEDAIAAREALKAAAERQAFLLDLSDRIRALGDAREIMLATTRMLGEHLNLLSAHILVIDEGNVHAKRVAIYLHHAAPPTNEPLEVALAELPEWEEVKAHGDVFTNADRGHASSTIALWRGETVAGLFVATCRERTTWAPAERQLQRDVADRMWLAVERAQVAKALRERNIEREELLATARRAQADAERANRAKDEFLATLGHELRTPLAAILLWSSAIKSGLVASEDLDNAIDAVTLSAKTQSRLIEDLLDLSRLTAGRLELRLQRCAVAETLAAAIALVRPVAQAKEIVLEAQLGELGVARIDPIRIQQVVWNLLGNALKFTESGGRVTIRARGERAAVEIEVIDNGEGIAPEFLPQLFERFRQADMKDTRKHGGLGVGLALSRELVELHGGTITATSEGSGHGARFVVTLPRGDIRAEDASGYVDPFAGSPLRGVRVLLVESDLRSRAVMQRTLEHAGAEVIATGNAPEALRVFDRGGELTSVIVWDVGRPDPNGFDALLALAEGCLRAGTSLPACAVTSLTSEIDAQRLVRAGFDFHLVTPFSSEQLVNAVLDLKAIAQPLAPLSEAPPR